MKIVRYHEGTFAISQFLSAQELERHASQLNLQEAKRDLEEVLGVNILKPGTERVPLTSLYPVRSESVEVPLDDYTPAALHAGLERLEAALHLRDIFASHAQLNKFSVKDYQLATRAVYYESRRR